MATWQGRQLRMLVQSYFSHNTPLIFSSCDIPTPSFNHSHETHVISGSYQVSAQKLDSWNLWLTFLLRRNAFVTVNRARRQENI